jgi:hypothetical protein
MRDGETSGALCTRRSNSSAGPHPDPLPGGEGTKRSRPKQSLLSMSRYWLITIAFLFVAILTIGLRAQTPTSDPSPRFTFVDVFVDPHGTPLAAYQLEFLADPARVTLVGIEGGSHTAFKDPPYYDPAALSGNRVILAALNTGADVPRDKTRVARLHLRIQGTDKPTMSSKLIVAASSNEQKIQADVTVSQGANP